MTDTCVISYVISHVISWYHVLCDIICDFISHIVCDIIYDIICESICAGFEHQNYVLYGKILKKVNDLTVQIWHVAYHFEYLFENILRMMNISQSVAIIGLKIIGNNPPCPYESRVTLMSHK